MDSILSLSFSLSRSVWCGVCVCVNIFLLVCFWRLLFNFVFSVFCHAWLRNYPCCHQRASYSANSFIINLPNLAAALNSAVPSLLKHFPLLAFITFFSCQFPINFINLLCCFILAHLATQHWYSSRLKADPSTLLTLAS